MVLRADLYITVIICPPPSPAVLTQWKHQRAKIGSQCSWLTLKIAMLDKKISSLNKTHTNLKNKKQSRHCDLPKGVIKKNFQILIDNNKNGIIPMEAENIEVVNNHGCSRTNPISNKQYHKYVRRDSISLIPSISNYRCRCIHSSSSCRLCSKQSTDYKDFSNGLVEMCDESYHSVLSSENDVSLSFLLEETLRRQRINTKVTITKSTKKKKKNSSINSSLDTTKTYAKHPTVKSKSERSKSDEYSRKRYAASDISSKLKKFRKLSESHSCDSGSKPSTPTNELASPLSQSLPCGSLSNLKHKKKSSSTVDYDINNIVIPYSIASSTRVERIQYKEIPTPGWRNANENLNKDDTDLDRELTDDESYSDRHFRCELIEQKRFTDYFVPVRRQRSARTSEGPNSEPPSPAYVEDVRSLVNTPVDSPVSSTHGNSILQTRMANVLVCPEEEREFPWSQRLFPLTETESKKLEVFSEPPSPLDEKLFSKPTALPRSPSFTLISSSSPRSSPLPSPLISPVTPDANWTVRVVNNDSDSKEPVIPIVSTVEKQRKGIVLKLAKK